MQYICCFFFACTHTHPHTHFCGRVKYVCTASTLCFFTRCMLDMAVEAQSRCDTWTPGTVLNLSGMGLTALPRLPAELKWLQCSSNELTTLGPQPLPHGLTHLYCGTNKLETLGPHPLPAGLTHLYCGNNKLKALGPLPGDLEHLCCYDNLLSELSHPLPPALAALNCSGNRMRELSPLHQLPDGLTELWCFGNLLRELGSLPAGLTRLHCDTNQLRDVGFLPAGLINLTCDASVRLPDTWPCTLRSAFFNGGNGSIFWDDRWRQMVLAGHVSNRTRCFKTLTGRMTLRTGAILLFV